MNKKFNFVRGQVDYCHDGERIQCSRKNDVIGEIENKYLSYEDLLSMVTKLITDLRQYKKDNNSWYCFKPDEAREALSVFSQVIHKCGEDGATVSYSHHLMKIPDLMERAWLPVTDESLDQLLTGKFHQPGKPLHYYFDEVIDSIQYLLDNDIVPKQDTINHVALKASNYNELDRESIENGIKILNTLKEYGYYPDKISAAGVVGGNNEIKQWFDSENIKPDPDHLQFLKDEKIKHDNLVQKMFNDYFNKKDF